MKKSIEAVKKNIESYIYVRMFCTLNLEDITKMKFGGFLSYKFEHFSFVFYNISVVYLRV